MPKAGARSMLLTGALWTAQQALELGLFSQIVPPNALIDRAVGVAVCPSQSRAAYGQTKAILNESVHVLINTHPQFATSASRIATTMALPSKM